ncbi:unnamed protein product [Clonostachys rosea]|uniref:Metallo-beta-lactamase domain-containing protein n=1 Tax=Bionectria ochroleuca TaxID=29856 RepID=A0ABY6U965_BIOOC|nr:unnamed protein product [Clonostachys rosea]
MSEPRDKKVSFARPLPQSTRSDVLEWKFPKPFHQYVLTGRSRAAWHTSFVIPQLNLLLDAGLVVNRHRPKHIFLTHGHSDHTLLSSAFVKREDPPDIFCPAGMKSAFNDFILAKTMLNLGGLIQTEDAEKYGMEMNGHTSNVRELDDRERTPGEAAYLNTHHTHGVRHGDVVPLRRLKGITATVFDCDHSVPCVGYVFNTTTNRLKPEYASFEGSELKNLRQSGVEITEPHTTPMFAFLGDTTAETLASEPEWLRNGIPVVITECSFLLAEHREQAIKTKHTYWPDLEKVIRKWPKTTFVLTHFSLRYSEKHITAFFADLPDCPENIVVWADEEA